jgi:hypothetical protein
LPRIFLPIPVTPRKMSRNEDQNIQETPKIKDPRTKHPGNTQKRESRNEDSRTKYPATKHPKNKGQERGPKNEDQNA